MRFSTIATLLASTTAVLAAPASEKQNQCCGCDPFTGQVVCTSLDDPSQCISIQVECPAGAPTVYATGGPVATTLVPASLTSEYAKASQTGTKAKRQVDVDTEVHPQCCCCNATLGSIICTNTLDANSCHCPKDMCPDGAPTIHATGTNAAATPTPPPKAHPLVGPIVIRDASPSDQWFGPDTVPENQKRDEWFGPDVGSDNQKRDEWFGPDAGSDSQKRDEEFAASDVEERSEQEEEGTAECCHCDYVAKQNICTRSKQCPYPKIENCIFEATYV